MFCFNKVVAKELETPGLFQGGRSKRTFFGRRLAGLKNGPLRRPSSAFFPGTKRPRLLSNRDQENFDRRQPNPFAAGGKFDGHTILSNDKGSFKFVGLLSNGTVVKKLILSRKDVNVVDVYMAGQTHYLQGLGIDVLAHVRHNLMSSEWIQDYAPTAFDPGNTAHRHFALNAIITCLNTPPDTSLRDFPDLRIGNFRVAKNGRIKVVDVREEALHKDESDEEDLAIELNTIIRDYRTTPEDEDLLKTIKTLADNLGVELMLPMQ